MLSTTGYALVSVPVVAFAYLATSFAYCELERRQRTGSDGALSRVPEATVVSFVALLTATLAFLATDWVSDARFEYVLAGAPNTLLPWQQAAVWAGVAAVLGHVAPVWNGFRGGSGLAPAAIVAFAFMPVVLLAAVAGWFAGMLVSKRRDVPLRTALLVAPLAAWVAWIFGIGDIWGVPLGAEAMLAVVVAVGLLAARNRGVRRADGA